MFITIKTSDDIAEICLFDGKVLKKERKWQAGQELSRTILTEISNIVNDDFDILDGIVVFTGPGSFTGLRIGISVANALAYGKNLPVVGENGENWVEKGIGKIIDGQNDKIVVPEYGSEFHITEPKRLGR